MSTRAAAIRAGRAFVEIFADSNPLTNGLKQVEAQLTSFGAKITKIGASFTALGGSILTPLALASKRFGDIGDKLYELSIETRVSVESLSELGYVSEQTGGTLDSLGRNIYLMGQFVTRAATNAFGADKTLQRLGLTFQDIADLNVEERFLVFAEALSRVSDASERSNLARNVFGRGARENLALFGRGAEWIEQMRASFRKRGLTISTADAEAANQFHDILADVASFVNKLVFVIGKPLAKAFSGWFERVKMLSKPLIDLIEANGALIVRLSIIGLILSGVGAAFVGFGVSVIFVGAIVGTFVTALQALYAGLTLVLTVFTSILSPVGTLIGSLGFLATRFVDFAEVSAAALNWLRQKFTSLYERVKEVIGAIVDALQGGDIKLAAEVFWAGLSVAWAEGVMLLKQGLFSLRDVWNDLWSGLARFALSTMTSLVINLTKIWDYIQDRWVSLLEWQALREVDAATNLAIRVVNEDEGRSLRSAQTDDERGRIKKTAQSRRDQILLDSEKEQSRILRQGRADSDTRDVVLRELQTALEDYLVRAVEKIDERLAAKSNLAGKEVDEARERLAYAKDRLAAALTAVKELPKDSKFELNDTIKSFLDRIRDVSRFGLGSATNTIRGAYTLSSGQLLGLQANSEDRVIKSLEAIVENTEQIAVNTESEGGLAE